MLLPSKHFTPPIAIAKKKLKKHYTSPYCPFSFSYFPFPFRVETCRPCTLKGNVYACGNIRLGSPALCVHHNISSFSADCNKAFLFLLATTTFSSLYLHIIYIYIYILLWILSMHIYTHIASHSLPFPLSQPNFLFKKTLILFFTMLTVLNYVTAPIIVSIFKQKQFRLLEYFSISWDGWSVVELRVHEIGDPLQAKIHEILKLS